MQKMAKSIRCSQNWPEMTLEVREIHRRLVKCNAFFTRGAYRYMRIAIHLVSTVQFSYCALYHWFLLELDEIERPQSLYWGGQFKCLTFVNAVVQATYHFVALQNDVFGINTLEAEPPSKLRLLRDYMFAAFSFPCAQNVCLSFWALLTFEQGFTYPAEIRKFLPVFIMKLLDHDWINHLMHTNISMLCILDMFTCFRQYPRRLYGAGGTCFFTLAYIVWLHIVYYNTGHWVYPLLEGRGVHTRCLILGAVIGFNHLLYVIGERFNNHVWGVELRLLAKLKQL